MFFGGATVQCNSGIVQALTALEQQQTGNAATHRLISNGNFIFLRNTGNPNLNNLIGTFTSVTGQVQQINTTQGIRNLMTVTGALPPGSPGCFPPPPPPVPTPTPQPGGGDQTLLLLILLLSGGLGGGGRGGRGGLDINSLLPLLLLGGGGGLGGI